MSKELNLIQSEIDVERRQIIKWLVASPLLLTSFKSRADFFSFMAIHAVRFIGGMIFEAVAAVLVKAVVNYFSSGSSGFYSSLPSDRDNFNHNGYKLAVKRLGLSDAEYEKSRIVKLNLKGDANLARFEQLHRYLYDNDIRVIPAGAEYSQEITLKTSPDDLFTINSFHIDNANEALRQHHYTKMIEATGSQEVFKKLSI